VEKKGGKEKKGMLHENSASHRAEKGQNRARPISHGKKAGFGFNSSIKALYVRVARSKKRKGSRGRMGQRVIFNLKGGNEGNEEKKKTGKKFVHQKRRCDITI